MTEIFQIGTKILDRYRLDSLLGAGGMGTVYKVYDELLNVHIALKVSVSSKGSKNRSSFLLREYETLKKFDHPAIPKAYDQGNIDDVAFFSMDLIRGVSLNQIIEEHKLPDLGVLIDWLKQIVLILSYIHKQGYLYCDLKPDNIIICETLDHKSIAKLIDFGITVPLTEGLKASDLDARGTTEYMSPEQHRGKKVDVKSDIYSFGVLAFEVLTGERPYKLIQPIDNQITRTLKYSAMHTAGKIPSPKSKNSLVPKTLSSIVEVCLSKDKSHRFQNADELYKYLVNANNSSTMNSFFNFIKRSFSGLMHR